MRIPPYKKCAHFCFVKTPQYIGAKARKCKTSEVKTMYNGGEAAAQMVSYSLKGGKVLLRLTGDGAKHLAIYLANLLKQAAPARERPRSSA
jgi:hypothetical protein